MLTVFGSKGGDDTYWCGFVTSGFVTNGTSADLSNFVGPIPFKLPPNNGRVYNTSEDGFGMAGVEVPLGFLESIDSLTRQPKPCRHLNATGTVMMTPSNGFCALGSGSWKKFSNVDARLSPSATGVRVSQFQGFATPKGAYYYWKRNGSTAINSSSDYYTRLGCGFPIGNKSIPTGTVPYRHGMRVYLPVAPYTFSQRYMEYMYAPIINGLNSFKFIGDYADRVLPGTLGSYYNCEGSYDISKIVGNTDGTFAIYGTYHLITRRHSIDAYGNRIDFPDKVEKSTGWRRLLLMSPNNIPAEKIFNFGFLSQELKEYEKLAKAHYSSEMMKVARNNAIADITALKSNNLENISGLKGSFNIIGTLFQGYKAVTTGDIPAAIKALSGAYLWYSYAAAPTLRDVRDITDNVGQISSLITKNPFSNERRRGRAETHIDEFVGDTQFNVTYHTRLKDNYYSQLYSGLQRLGLHPAVSQGWDLIPYSFVIDWFLGIGPILEKLDNYNNFKLTRDILSRIESFKASKTEEYRVSEYPSLYEFIGPYEKSYYDRRIHSGSGDVDPFAGQASAGVRSSQVMQGTSLLIQQLD